MTGSVRGALSNERPYRDRAPNCSFRVGKIVRPPYPRGNSTSDDFAHPTLSGVACARFEPTHQFPLMLRSFWINSGARACNEAHSTS
jgi:hypothetical protein